ncbi:nitrate/nitrite transporter [Gordonibacter sp. RACS_AR68]|uniref:MFS transporter n=1 Tax=Gordonibacter sp. RACS_AR68 TaxID=2872005 RepID=UPI00260EEC9F|nr:MFS transporter [Gordonibacter sp. RACS_AR68]MDN4470536.1 MFS transporter [Gordonibacter sp. RACS_AR68]
MSTDIDARSKKRAMLVFVGCCVMQACGLGTVLNSSSAFFAIVPAAVGVDMGVFAMWITCYGIAALFGTFFAGILIPKFGAKTVISFDVVVTALCVVAFTFADASWTWQFMAIGAVMGLTGGMYFLYATPLLMGAWFGKKVLGRYLGIAQLMSGVGGALFPLVFTSLSTVMGWQSAYYLNAILLLCILFFSLTVFCEDPAKIGLHAFGAEEDEMGESKSLPGVPLKFALPTLAFVLLFLGCMLSAFPGSFNSFVQANAVEVLGPEALIFSSTLMIALQVGYIIASLVGGILVDKIGVRWLTVILYAILIVCYVSFSMASTELALMVTAFFFGMNNAIVTISVPMLAREHFGMKAYDKILSYCMMGVGLCGSMGAPVIGIIFDMTKTYSGSFLVGAVIAVVAIAIILLSFVPAKKVREAHWEA